MRDSGPKLVGLAGSNVAYIGMVCTDTLGDPAQTYHNQLAGWDPNALASFTYVHDLDDTDRDIKISFDDKQEIIVLNWQVKFRIKAQTESDKSKGDAWTKEQQKLWQSYGQDWEIRSVLRWTHTVCNDARLRSNYDNIGLRFRGESLYEGYDSASKEFKKIGAEYPRTAYDTWRESQIDILKFLELMEQATTLAQVKKLDNNVLKGIALGVYAKKHGISEEDVWHLYIK